MTLRYAIFTLRVVVSRLMVFITRSILRKFELNHALHKYKLRQKFRVRLIVRLLTFSIFAIVNNIISNLFFNDSIRTHKNSIDVWIWLQCHIILNLISNQSCSEAKKRKTSFFSSFSNSLSKSKLQKLGQFDEFLQCKKQLTKREEKSRQIPEKPTKPIKCV